MICFNTPGTHRALAIWFCTQLKGSWCLSAIRLASCFTAADTPTAEPSLAEAVVFLGEAVCFLAAMAGEAKLRQTNHPSVKRLDLHQSFKNGIREDFMANEFSQARVIGFANARVKLICVWTICKLCSVRSRRTRCPYP